jgi:hypothetical protein
LRLSLSAWGVFCFKRLPGLLALRRVSSSLFIAPSKSDKLASDFCREAGSAQSKAKGYYLICVCSERLIVRVICRRFLAFMQSASPHQKSNRSRAEEGRPRLISRYNLGVIVIRAHVLFVHDSSLPVIAACAICERSPRVFLPNMRS